MRYKKTKKYTSDELSAIVATLPGYCKHFTKYNSRNGIELELIKTETGEWQDVTPEPVVKRKKHETVETIESLEAQLAALEQKLSEVYRYE